MNKEEDFLLFANDFSFSFIKNTPLKFKFKIEKYKYIVHFQGGSI